MNAAEAVAFLLVSLIILQINPSMVSMINDNSLGNNVEELPIF